MKELKQTQYASKIEKIILIIKIKERDRTIKP
jgi:hypothetical protein